VFRKTNSLRCNLFHFQTPSIFPVFRANCESRVKRTNEYRLDRAIAAFYDREAPSVDPAGMAAQMKVLEKEDW
jgi:hypothetical protein